MLENFLPTDTFSLHGHMAAVEDSKARDESKTATGCMLVDNDSSADGHRESDGSSAILDRVIQWVNASLMGSTFSLLYLDRPLAGNNRLEIIDIKLYPRSIERV